MPKIMKEIEEEIANAEKKSTIVFDEAQVPEENQAEVKKLKKQIKMIEEKLIELKSMPLCTIFFSTDSYCIVERLGEYWFVDINGTKLIKFEDKSGDCRP